jgi:hypothetical protein
VSFVQTLGLSSNAETPISMTFFSEAAKLCQRAIIRCCHGHKQRHFDLLTLICVWRPIPVLDIHLQGPKGPLNIGYTVIPPLSAARHQRPTDLPAMDKYTPPPKPSSQQVGQPSHLCLISESTVEDFLLRIYSHWNNRLLGLS